MLCVEYLYHIEPLNRCFVLNITKQVMDHLIMDDFMPKFKTNICQNLTQLYARGNHKNSKWTHKELVTNMLPSLASNANVLTIYMSCFLQLTTN